MAKRTLPHQYELLAQYYGQFFTFHLQWYRTARRKVLGSILRRTGSVCDLACGTGTTAVELARHGIKVFAVDISPVMCRMTRRKAIRVHTQILVLRGDMRTFRLPAPVDLITCEFDALNHVPQKADLKRVAKSVAQALNPGGHFYFDVNNRMAFQLLWPGTWWCEKPGVVLVMRGGYDSRYDRGWTKAEWFARRDAGGGGPARESNR
jgi:SAM-dependent methyltransferase